MKAYLLSIVRHTLYVVPLIATIAHADTILRVDDNSGATNPDGLTWQTAFNNLPAALAAAAGAGQGNAVHVPNLYIQRPFSLNAAGQIAAEAIFLGVGRVFSVVLTPEYPAIGDTNCDQAVNIDDLLAVVGTWFAFGGPTDLNNDNIVDLSDLLIVVDHWSQ